MWPKRTGPWCLVVTLGHDHGDELLRQVGQRLVGCVRQIDTVARMGGDEFVIVLSDLSEHKSEALTQAYGIAEKVRASLLLPLQFNESAVETSCSLGLQVFNDSAEQYNDILKRGDMALYHAKANGRNQISVFDPALEAGLLAHASLLADLRKALSRNEFVLFFQPIVDRNARVIGQEALLRWRTVMTAGTIQLAGSPGEFFFSRLDATPPSRSRA